MDKLKLIQCGVGGHGGSWVPITSNSPDFDLVAVVDVVPEQLEKVGEQTGLDVSRRFSSLEEALDAVEADEVVMRALGPVCWPELLRVKRFELARYDRQVGEWEREVYFERV